MVARPRRRLASPTPLPFQPGALDPSQKRRSRVPETPCFGPKLAVVLGKRAFPANRPDLNTCKLGRMVSILVAMAYESVDKLQNTLAETVFTYATDQKKAAGRALGTLVELITFYLLKTWGLGASVAIERGLAEYKNPGITHNVEYSLHPVKFIERLRVTTPELPITPAKIFRTFGGKLEYLQAFERKGHQLLSYLPYSEERLRFGGGGRFGLGGSRQFIEWEGPRTRFGRAIPFTLRHVGVQTRRGRGGEQEGTADNREGKTRRLCSQNSFVSPEDSYALWRNARSDSKERRHALLEALCPTAR